MTTPNTAPPTAPTPAPTTSPNETAHTTDAEAIPITGAPSCPKCGARMWDNRSSKRNRRAPDFKCRNRSCDGVLWPGQHKSAVPIFPPRPHYDAASEAETPEAVPESVPGLVPAPDAGQSSAAAATPVSAQYAGQGSAGRGSAGEGSTEAGNAREGNAPPPPPLPPADAITCDASPSRR